MSTIRTCAALLALGVIASLAPWTIAVANAHTGEANFDVLDAASGSDLVIDLRLRVRYSGDNNPAERVFLSVTPTSPDGRELPSVELERRAGGVYQGVISVDEPGRWTLSVTSAFPPGGTSLTVDAGTGEGGGSQLAPVGLAGVVVAGLGLVSFVVLRRRGRA